MKNYIVEVENLSLKYQFIKSMNFRNLIIKTLKREKIEERVKVVEALKNISFKIEKGKTVGIIGENGAGKSTLLRVLAQIFEPDSGKVIVNTDSISLLALGAGFQKELSGIENIYLNGLLLGLQKSEIDSRLEEIIEFSELEDFIHAPIRTYSSGMKSKLAFSTAVHIEPELLLIDEVFSVGDARFKKKSGKKIRELIDSNRTVVMVSHNLNRVKELCDEVIWLHKGMFKGMGETKKIIKEYESFTSK